MQIVFRYELKGETAKEITAGITAIAAAEDELDLGIGRIVANQRIGQLACVLHAALTEAARAKKGKHSVEPWPFWFQQGHLVALEMKDVIGVTPDPFEEPSSTAPLDT